MRATARLPPRSDWNPQNDLQAMARCHRIGQVRDVTVYRLVSRNTYEQQLFECASRKAGLDEAILGFAGTGAGLRLVGVVWLVGGPCERGGWLTRASVIASLAACAPRDRVTIMCCAAARCCWRAAPRRREP